MLILVGVTISITTNSGIISKTKEAAVQMEIAQIQEQLVLKKAEVIMDNGGNIPSDYGITLNDLDIPSNLKTKYASKLTISQDGTLHYIADAVTEEEIAVFTNAGITASSESEQQPQPVHANVEYYSMTNGSGSDEMVFVIDYVNSVVKVYGGSANGNLYLNDSPHPVTFSTDSFTVLLDNVETTITDATAILSEGFIVAYVQNNQLFSGEPHENSLTEFTSDSIPLNSNFDTTRLVDSPMVEYYKTMNGQEVYVTEIDYTNSTLKAYYSADGSSYTLNSSYSVSLNDAPFYITIDGQGTDFSEGTVIYENGNLVAFISDNKLYEAENGEFSSSRYSTLDSEFDTSVLP